MELASRVSGLYRGHLLILVAVEIVGLDAEGEVLKPDVCRIRPVCIAVTELLHVSGRGKEFHAYT